MEAEARISLFGYIRSHATSKSKHNAALVSESHSIDYETLMHLLAYHQKKLRETGYGEGQAVVLQSRGQFEFAISFLSLLAAGCYVLPIPSDASAREVERISKLSNAKIFDDVLEIRSPIRGEVLDPDEDTVGIYHTTSGSTGVPKLCIRTLKAMTAEGESYKETFCLSAEDRLFSCPPLHHSYAMGAGLIAALVSGASLYVGNAFSPRKILRTIQRSKVTFLILVPIMARAICEVFSKEVFDLSSVRVALVGAGPITKEVYEGFLGRFGIPLLSNYGSTETGGVVSRLESLPFSSIGRPMVGVEIRICNEGGQPVPADQEGELRVRCPGMLKGYLSSNEPFLDESGFFSMGDYAVQDKAGFLYIRGRKKRFINIGGRKVDPLEVEEVILNFPGVRECVVIGLPRRGEEVVKAVVVGCRESRASLRSHCSKRLASYKVPSNFEFRDRLPRNEIGKIDMEQLILTVDKSYRVLE